MIAREWREEQLSGRSRPSIVDDALTRIPAAHFLNRTEATYHVETCAAMLADAANGDRCGLWRWLGNAASLSDERPRKAVLHAVCDAMLAAAFHSSDDVTGIGSFIVSIERELVDRLAFDRRDGDWSPAVYPRIAELSSGFVRIVQLHDRDTAAHLESTATLARQIALTMKLPTEQVAMIEFAARLHDIGKIGIRRELLHQLGPLGTIQWRELRRQVELGVAALEDTPGLARLAPIVRATHERMDGGGYPDGRSGCEIPLESRVLSVADAFDAMTSERSYRKARTPSDALTILTVHAGSQFDPNVVAATIELVRSRALVQRKIA